MYSLCAALEIVVMGALIAGGRRGAASGRRSSPASPSLWPILSCWRSRDRSARCSGVKPPGRSRSVSSPTSGSASCNRPAAPPRRRGCAVLERRPSGGGGRGPGAGALAQAFGYVSISRRRRDPERRGPRHDLLGSGVRPDQGPARQSFNPGRRPAKGQLELQVWVDSACWPLTGAPPVKEGAG